MPATLNGTSQYYSLGITDIYRTFPWTVAVKFKPASIAVWNGMFSQGQGGTANAWSFEISNTGKMVVGVGTASTTSTGTPGLPAANEWYTLVVVYAAPAIQYYYMYRHSTNTLTAGNDGLVTTAPTAPGFNNTVIGAWGDSGTSVTDFSNGQISWVAIFKNDKSMGGGSRPPAIMDLALDGFWNQLDNNCAMAVSFATANPRELILGRTLTAVAAPTYPGPPQIVEFRPAAPFIWVPVATGGGTITATASTAPGRASTQSTSQVTRSLTSSAFARASAASTLAAIRATTSVILGKAGTSSALKATKSVSGTSAGRAATTTQLSATKAITSLGKGAASTTTGQMTATKAVSGSSAGKAGTSSQLAATKPMAVSASSGKAQTTTAITRTVTLVSTVQGRGATTVSATVTRSVTGASTGRASTTASFTITKAVSSATNGRARTQSALAVTVALPASVSRGNASTVSAGVVGTGGGTIQAPPSTSRGSARVVSSCTVTRTISGQVLGRAIISQSTVNVTRSMAASTSKGQAQVAASVSVSRTFTTRAAGRAFTLSSVSITLSVQAVASGRARVITSQPQVAKQLTSGVQARARLTSGVNLQKFLSGLSQGRARTVSGFSVIQPITFYPFRPLVIITEAPRPVATIAEVSRPVATIAANASVPVSKIVQAPGPAATITDVTRPTATISEVKP